jgi:DNA polymerase I-like protein with 3'-5' exonuclease and polymerase domains
VCKYRPYRNDIDEFFYNKTQAKKEGIQERYSKYACEYITQGSKELWEDIAKVNPDVILALGNTALWALTGEWGITKWRGSTMTALGVRANGTPYKVIPTLHPAAVLRAYHTHIYLEHDLRTRLTPLTPEIPDPGYKFLTSPTYPEVDDYLNMIIHELLHHPHRIASDIETRLAHISCTGLGISKTEAICIPFMRVEKPHNYWTYAQQVEIIDKLRIIHTHPNALITGQNFDYDRQYMARYWGIKSNLNFDTMTAHHLLWPGTLKGLSVLSSLYCAYHLYWKEESKDWDGKNEEQLWIYNCKDCVTTYEIADVLAQDIIDSNMTEQYQFQLQVQEATFYSLLRGINYDTKLRDKFGIQLVEDRMEHENYLIDIVGTEKFSKSKTAKKWCNSPQQAAHFFYNVMHIAKVFNKKTKRPTTDAEALKIIAKREPLVRPICQALEELRSISLFYSNYILAKLDRDNRIRCQLKITGTETFRFASSTDAFGFGTNLQTIPSGNKLEDE